MRLGVVATVGWLGVMAAYRCVPNETLFVLSGRDGDPIPEAVNRIASAVLDWRRAEDLHHADAAIARIHQQIAANPQHAWAGKYVFHYSDDSTRIYLGPGLEFVWWQVRASCGGHWDFARLGKITSITDSQILVQTSDYGVDFDPSRRTLKFRRVRWGDRSFLLDTAALLYRSNAPITLDDLCSQLAWRTGESPGPLEAWPELPPEISERFAGFPPTLSVIGAFETTEPRTELDPEQGDAEYCETVNRIVVVDLAGELCLPDRANVTGLYAGLPGALSTRVGGVMRIELQYAGDFPLPAIGWRFAIDSAEWDDVGTNGDGDGDGAEELAAYKGQSDIP